MSLFQSILFAADFSENSKAAFRAACSLATGDKTRFVVLHVADPSRIAEEPGYYRQQDAPMFPMERDRAFHEALREKLHLIYTPLQPLDIVYSTSEGEPAEEILRMAKGKGSDVIVMGTHGHTALRRILAGSVAVAVLRGAACPVLALRSAAQPRPAKEIRVIIHATDFSVYSEAALRVARLLAREHGARLTILHVAALEGLMDGTSGADIDPRVYHDALEGVRKRVDGPDLKHPVETVVRRGFAAEAIIETASEMACDLIVVGTHGRTGLSRLLMGSVAEYVLPRASCPVLVVKAAKRISMPVSDRRVDAARAVT